MDCKPCLCTTAGFCQRWNTLVIPVMIEACQKCDETWIKAMTNIKEIREKEKPKGCNCGKVNRAGL